MAKTCTFFLKDPKAEETLVYFLFNFGFSEIGLNGKKTYRPLKGSTQEKINPANWDATKYRAKQSKKFLGYPEFNSRLDKIEATLYDIHRYFLNNGVQPSPEQIKEEFDRRIGRSKPKVSSSFIDFVEMFISERKATKKYNTVRSYRAALKQLHLYSKFTANEMIEYTKLNGEEQEKLYNNASRKRKVDFDDITIGFYHDFILWNKAQGRSINYIGALVKNIKVFMMDAVERKLTDNIDFKSRHFKVIEEEADTIYLTEEEVSAIVNLNLEENPRLDKVRDLFIIACHTGLRFSDFGKITPENIKVVSGKTILQIATEKTGKEVAIPVMPIVQRVISKYDGNLPRRISNQKMNNYLKEIGRLAGINCISKGSKLKYELITTHTGRRTALTNMSLNGVPSIALMKISGHSTEKSFLKYLKMSATESAVRLMDLPYFQQGGLKAV